MLETVCDYYVYLYFDATLPIDEPIYTGKGIGHRDMDHLSECWRVERDMYNSPFHRTLRKMLKDGNTPEIVRVYEGLTELESFLYEQELIREYGRKDLKTGCLLNLTAGGDGASGYRHTEEAKDKIRLAFLGKRLTDEIMEKISAKRKEQGNFGYLRRSTTETKAKMSEAQLAMSTENREKIRKGSRKRFGRPICRCDDQGKMLGKPYETTKDAERDGYDRRNISKYLGGRCKYYRGHWRDLTTEERLEYFGY